MPKKCKIVRTVSGQKANEVVAKKDGVTRLIQWMAPWCSACQETKLEVDQANRRLCDQGIETVRINADKNEALADKFDIEDLPTVVAMRDGKVLGEVRGADDADAFVKLALKALKK